jgi:hypothetical protein
MEHWKYTKKANSQAQSLFQKAIEIDHDYAEAVDGRDKVSQKWSFKNEPPGKGTEFNVIERNLNSELKRRQV